MKYSQLPSCAFEIIDGHYTDISQDLLEELKDPASGYSKYSAEIIQLKDSIWQYFEMHFNHLLNQIKFVLRDYSHVYFSRPFPLYFTLIQGIAIETRILTETLIVILGDHGANPFYADKKDLLLYYTDWICDLLKPMQLKSNNEQFQDIWPFREVPKASRHNSGVNKTKNEDDYLPSLDEVIFYDSKEADCAYKELKNHVGNLLSSLICTLELTCADCDYYISENADEINQHISSIREVFFFKIIRRQIVSRQEDIYKSLKHEHLLKHSVISDELKLAFRKEALYRAVRERWPEAYKSYDENRHLLEIEKNDLSGSGLMKEWMSNVFRNQYEGEQRDENGNLVAVHIDNNGETHIKGKSGWEKWIDLLVVAALLQEDLKVYNWFSDETISLAIKAALAVEGARTVKWVGIWFAWKKMKAKLPNVADYNAFIELMNSERFRASHEDDCTETSLKVYYADSYLDNTDIEDWKQEDWNPLQAKANKKHFRVIHAAALIFTKALRLK